MRYAGGSTDTAGRYVQRYTLDGVANSSLLPANPSDWDGHSPAHPATYVELVEIPQSTSPLGLVDGTLYQETTVNLAGVPATAVTPRNGYGT